MMPERSRRLAALWASLRSAPHTSIPTSEPSRITSARPMTNGSCRISARRALNRTYQGALSPTTTGNPSSKSASSAGQKTLIPGIVRISATSSNAWWVGPFASERRPGT